MIIAHHIIISTRKYHKIFRFSERQFITFLYRIECEYNQTEYHSAYHAADVLVSVNWCLDHSHLMQQNLNDIEKFSLLIASLVHDVGHNGRNNEFHIQTASDLAITYHDRSPLENYHISTAFRCLFHSDSNWMGLFSVHLQKEIKGIITDCVLHTDMRHHQQTIDRVARLLHDIDEERRSRGTAPDDIRLNGQQRGLLMSTMLHLCDISNPTKPFHVSLKWGLKVCAEFFGQGDEEMDIGLSVTPLCNRQSSDIMKGQIGFSRFVVLPLLEMMLFLFPEFKIMKQFLLQNLRIFSKVSASDKRPENTIDAVGGFFEDNNPSVIADLLFRKRACYTAMD